MSTAPTVGKCRLRKQKGETLGEGEKQTTVPSLTSLTPVAMPTIEREVERGGRESGVVQVREREQERERERGGEAKYGRQLEVNSPLSGQDDRQASGRCERSHGIPQGGLRRKKALPRGE